MSLPTPRAAGVVAAVARALAVHGRDGAGEALRVARDRLGLVAAPALSLEEVAPRYMREADADRAPEPIAAAQGSG